MPQATTRVTFGRDFEYDGKMRKGGSSLSVPADVARNLIFRGTARAEDSGAPGSAPATVAPATGDKK